MKRLRIRQRSPVSEANVDYLAGHHVGTNEGFKAGKSQIAKLYDNKIREMEDHCNELQRKLRKEEISFRELAHKHNEKTAENLRLCQEIAMLRAREDIAVHSDMLYLPPFVADATPWKCPNAMKLRNDRLSPTRNKMQRIEGLRQAYGGSLVGAMVGEGRSLRHRSSRRYTSAGLPQDWQRDPRLLEEFRNEMARVFNMPDAPPDDPIMHLAFDLSQAESRTAIALREVDQLGMGIPVEEIAPRVPPPSVTESRLVVPPPLTMPFNLGDAMGINSRDRTALEQSRLDNIERERVRQASAVGEGETNRVGGHSHAIDLDIQLDPQIREALDSLERFREAFGNAGISAETMADMLTRLGTLEDRMEEETSSCESEAQVNTGDRPGPTRKEQT